MIVIQVFKKLGKCFIRTSITAAVQYMAQDWKHDNMHQFQTVEWWSHHSLPLIIVSKEVW